MQKLIVSIIASVSLMFSGCAGVPFGSNASLPFKQAFGDAVRSLEGVGIASIPAVVKALKAKANSWLPQGQIYESLLGGVIKAFIAGNPQTPVEINSALEVAATTLQTTP